MRKITLSVVLAPLLLASAVTAQAQEPSSPPDTTQPRSHIVELKEKATLRMGDTVSLKGTDFSAKLVGFREPPCLGPKMNCASESKHPVPEFQLVSGTTTCDPSVKKTRELSAKPIDRDCAKKLAYRVHHDSVEDRAAVVVRIENRKKGK